MTTVHAPARTVTVTSVAPWYRCPACITGRLALIVVPALVLLLFGLAGCAAPGRTPEPQVVIDDGLEAGAYRSDPARFALPTWCAPRTNRCARHPEADALRIAREVRAALNEHERR